MVEEHLGIFDFFVQFLQSGLKRSGFSVNRNPPAFSQRVLSLLLLVLAYCLVQLFQVFMQRGKKRIEPLSQLTLRLVFLVHGLFTGMIHAVLLVSCLQLAETRPLLYQLRHGLLSSRIVQHFQ